MVLYRMPVVASHVSGNVILELLQRVSVPAYVGVEPIICSLVLVTDTPTAIPWLASNGWVQRNVVQSSCLSLNNSVPPPEYVRELTVAPKKF